MILVVVWGDGGAGQRPGALSDRSLTIRFFKNGKIIKVEICSRYCTFFGKVK